ncbi:hypothetical protein [Paludisphaera soli]|uniref:hypothetical protein n=1 Tax=Paludisphaera soli TaxID=2712865 RepID=UPI00197E7A93|nr:hypothetical protein [Paludisphaera soli]
MGPSSETPSLIIEPAGSKDTGVCECCGHHSRRVWGFVATPDAAVAAYYVHSTLGRVVEHGATFDVVLGAWGEGTSGADRSVVSLLYRLAEDGPGFMVVDAEGRIDDPNVASKALRRDEVVGRPIARQVFAITDAILEQDGRVAELLGRDPIPPADAVPGHRPARLTEREASSLRKRRWWEFWSRSELLDLEDRRP